MLARGQQVGADRLLDALWEGTPPPRARRACSPTSRTCAGRSSPTGRRARRAGCSSPAATATRCRSTSRRRRLAVRGPGRRGGRRRGPGRAGAAAREALALWRGPALAEYAGADWADAEARRLERDPRRRPRAAAAGPPRRRRERPIVVPEAEALLAEEPLREERWRLLALALYRSHRQADALAALRRARDDARRRARRRPRPGAARPRARGARAVPDAGRATEPEQPATAPQADLSRSQQRLPGRGASRPDLVDREASSASCGSACGARSTASRGSRSSRARPGSARPACSTWSAARPAPPGATVLAGRGSQLEKEFGFGVVRQLFDPLLADAGRARRTCSPAPRSAPPGSSTPPSPRSTPSPRACSRCCTGSTG